MADIGCVCGHSRGDRSHGGRTWYREFARLSGALFIASTAMAALGCSKHVTAPPQDPESPSIMSPASPPPEEGAATESAQSQNASAGQGAAGGQSQGRVGRAMDMSPETPPSERRESTEPFSLPSDAGLQEPMTDAEALTGMEEHDGGEGGTPDAGAPTDGGDGAASEAMPDAGVEPAPLLPDCDPRPAGEDVYLGDLSVTSQHELDALAGYTRIDGTLHIGATTDVTQLESLACLNEITGSLEIIDNPELASLLGLARLGSIGGWLTIARVPELAALSGLESLHSIGTSLVIGSSGLMSLEGIEGIRAIEVDVTISANPALQSLDGLDNLERVSGTVSLDDNPLLSDVSALASLREVHKIFFRNLPNVTRLDAVGLQFVENDCVVDFMDGLEHVGLDQLVAVGGSLQIAGNVALSELGLSGLTSVGGQLSIANNPSLSECAALAIMAQVGKPSCDCIGNADCP